MGVTPETTAKQQIADTLTPASILSSGVQPSRPLSRSPASYGGHGSCTTPSLGGSGAGYVAEPTAGELMGPIECFTVVYCAAGDVNLVICSATDLHVYTASVQFCMAAWKWSELYLLVRAVNLYCLCGFCVQLCICLS